jgi:hypothetical protein
MYALQTHQFLTHMTGYALVPDAYAQHVLKGLNSVQALVPDAHVPIMHH